MSVGECPSARVYKERQKVLALEKERRYVYIYIYIYTKSILGAGDPQIPCFSAALFHGGNKGELQEMHAALRKNSRSQKGKGSSLAPHFVGIAPGEGRRGACNAKLKQEAKTAWKGREAKDDAYILPLCWMTPNLAWSLLQLNLF